MWKREDFFLSSANLLWVSLCKSFVELFKTTPLWFTISLGNGLCKMEILTPLHFLSLILKLVKFKLDRGNFMLTLAIQSLHEIYTDHLISDCA